MRKVRIIEILIRGKLTCFVDSAPIQPQLKSKVGLDIKMTLHHHHPPPPSETQHQQYFSCYWPNFDQTLNAGFRDLQQQQHQNNNQQKQKKNKKIDISKLLLAQFWLNFKYRFLASTIVTTTTPTITTTPILAKL